VPHQQWDIQSSHPEEVTKGIASAASSIGQGLVGAAGALKTPKPSADATSQAASAGKVGPVADTSNTPQVESIKNYMRNPNMSNFTDMEYPTAFKFNRY
jgi:hypothetical protein